MLRRGNHPSCQRYLKGDWNLTHKILFSKQNAARKVSFFDFFRFRGKILQTFSVQAEKLGVLYKEIPTSLTKSIFLKSQIDLLMSDYSLSPLLKIVLRDYPKDYPKK